MRGYGLSEFPLLRLKRHEDKRLRMGHLWIFSNEVDTAATPLAKLNAGDLVQVITHDDRPLGVAYVNPASLICARLLDTLTAPDADWFQARLRSALDLRERLFTTPHYRWVYGESDRLPGLVIDRFDTTCVVQISTAGMQKLEPQVHAAIRAMLPEARILTKSDGSLRTLEGLPPLVQWSGARGEDPARVVEDALEFQAPLIEGQKTGWFYDQAANRKRLEELVRPDDAVLDVFSYVGAWGVRAAKLGARVTCIDASTEALEAAQTNARNNGVAIATRRGDAFSALAEIAQSPQRFDVVIIDPPAFAKRKKDLPVALAAYRRLNQLAMRALARDAILISCSCSYHVSADELQQAIAKAARAEHAQLQILTSGGQSADHPVHPAIPETRYLKAFFCRVTRSP